jgi:hypothetical protein
MNSLDSFLEGEQGVGMIDSTGQFTISADKALEKLAHSQLPDPSYWVLKVVQFATSYGVKAMEVKIGRRVTTVEMGLPRPLSVIQLQKGLDTVEPLPEPALDHLVTGLRALGGLESSIFVLKLKSLESCEFLFWDGSKLSTKREEKRSDESSLTLEISSRGASIWNTDLFSRDRRLGETHALSKRAFVAPLELKIDGRALSYDQLEEPVNFVQPILWDFVAFEEGMELPSFMKVDPKDSILASAYWCISYNYEFIHKVLRPSPEPRDVARTSQVFWSKDGVIVKVNYLKPYWPFTINIFVDCRDCPADLGGLNLRESPQFLEKQVWVKAKLTEISDKASERISNLNELEGRTLGGWDALVASTSYLPLNQAVTYTRAGLVANTLNAHPGFRKKLLARIKESAEKRRGRLIPSELNL